MFLISDIQEKSESYSDQTGMFPVRSTTVNKYIFILYHYDINSIHALPIKSRHVDRISQAWQTIFDTLKYHSEAPEFHILDNK